MQQGGADTANNVKSQKSFWSPVIFQYASKHPKYQHIPENMQEAAVQKHVSNNLMGFKKIRPDIVQGEKILHKMRTAAFHGQLDQENDDINDDQVFDYGRYHL